MTSRSKRGNLEAALADMLLANSASQASLADDIGQSKPYVNQIIRGTKRPSPQWLDLVADAMRLSDLERVRLHRAACRDRGFKIDLAIPTKGRRR